jgi:hypothetical protein
MAAQRPPARPANGPQQPQAPRQRILRIGVLLGGKIVEERLIRERTGPDGSRCGTRSVPADGFPEFTLFALDEGRYSLRFMGKMDGRLSDAGGQVNTLEALKAKGSQQHGDYWQVPLSDSARGKLSFGDLTILFQFVTEPPRQPKPMLPASVRGTFADRFEPQLLVIIGASIIIHFAIVIIAWTRDLERDTMAEKAYELTFEPEKVMQAELVEPEPVAESGSAAGSADVKKPDKPTKAPPKDSGAAGRKDTDNVALNEDDAAAFADKLTFESATGTDAGDMSAAPGRRPRCAGSTTSARATRRSPSGGNGVGSRDGEARGGTARSEDRWRRHRERGGGSRREGLTVDPVSDTVVRRVT